MMVHLLSTESLQCISSGARFTRFEKTRRVAEFPPAFDVLDVCNEPQRSHGRPNCSVCSKCLRTQLALEVLGKLHMFADVFDVDRYRRVRFSYLISVLNSKDPLLTEISTQFDAHGFRAPPGARLLAMLRPRRLTFWLLLRAIAQACGAAAGGCAHDRLPAEPLVE